MVTAHARVNHGCPGPKATMAEPQQRGRTALSLKLQPDGWAFVPSLCSYLAQRPMVGVPAARRKEKEHNMMAKARQCLCQEEFPWPNGVLAHLPTAQGHCDLHCPSSLHSLSWFPPWESTTLSGKEDYRRQKQRKISSCSL